jgi:high affinity Mn2+ porin
MLGTAIKLGRGGNEMSWFVRTWTLVAVIAAAAGSPRLVTAQASTSDSPPATSATGGPEPTTEAASDAGSVFSHPEGQLWAAGQINLIDQQHGTFPAAYSGPHSLRDQDEHALSRLVTVYTGFAITSHFELLVDAEETGGRGISDALGLAGFTNLDVVRNPDLGGTPYIARVLVHYRLPLSLATEPAERSPVSSATRQPTERFDFWAGKMSVVDFFDLNAVGSDSHLQFTNWTVDNNGAFDYAADTRGYTIGAIAELDEETWSVRGGVAMMPTVANGIHLETDLTRARGEQLELEKRISWAHHKGAIRILGYRNIARMGSYSEAIAAVLAGTAAVPDITTSRRDGRTKNGIGLNAEQELGGGFRVFGRWGDGDGRNESFAYTEVDGTLELGADLNLPGRWGKVGVAGVENRLSGDHRVYLELGGIGFLLGDGALRYGPETIVEAYYRIPIVRGVSLSADAQHIANPGYNRARGPVWVQGLRLHIDF